MLSCVMLIAGATAVDSKLFSSSPNNKALHWKLHAQVSANTEHEVVFAIDQGDMQQLERELLEVSTPGSARFRQHMTFEEVGALINVGDKSKSVIQWISSNIKGSQIIKVSSRGEYIRVRSTVESFELAFDTKFYHWKSESVGKTALRCEQFTLPSTVGRKVKAVFGTTDFPTRVRSRPHLLEKNDAHDWTRQSINPAILSSFYSIDDNTASKDVGQSVFETSYEGYSPTDLAYFQGLHNIPLQEVSMDIGAHNTSAPCFEDINNCAESNLDVQYLMGVAQGANTTFYWAPDADDVFVTYVETMAALEHPPEVNSISWGSDEPENPAEVMDAFNTEVMKLGLMGVSVFVSSGDDGVGSRSWTNTSQCGYVASFPATSPYVTAVGATSAYSWEKPGQGEIVCQMNVMGGVITSGGGFSEHNEMPDWQRDAISQYFSEVNMTKNPKQGYNSRGRGYPDVSLSGYGYEVVLGGQTKYHMFGTSASAPTFAGMISLINAARRNAGASTLGFLNPSIYKYGMVNPALKIFNDITEGQNQCTSGGVCCQEGFYAAEGWDPATGFGSVNFTTLKAALNSDLAVVV